MIIRKCGSKIWRKHEGGGGQPIWFPAQNLPTYRDLDGFKVLALVARYLFVEFKDSIAEYIASLNLKPGPVLMAAGLRLSSVRPARLGASDYGQWHLASGRPLPDRRHCSSQT